MASKLADLFKHASALFHAFLGKIGQSGVHNLTEDQIQALIHKSYQAAEMLQKGKLTPEEHDLAVSFLHGLLSHLHGVNISDEELGNLVDQAILLARKFLAHKKSGA